MTGKNSTKNKVYTTKHKQKMADKISKLKKKEDLIKVAEIIYKENPAITENSNGIFMFFHKFSDETYTKIETYLKEVQERDNLTADSETNDSFSDPRSPTHEFKAFDVDEFHSQDGISPKLKLSNKEKNVLKRKRYDNSLSIENNTHSDIIVQEFNITNASDSATDPDPVEQKPVRRATRKR